MTCGVTGRIAWGRMATSQRQSFWVKKKDGLQCHQCAIKEKMDGRRLEQVGNWAPAVPVQHAPKAKVRPTCCRGMSCIEVTWDTSRDMSSAT
jgi:hypothetical protein